MMKNKYPRDEPVDIERARDEEEQDFARVGIPSRFWDTLLKDLSFRECSFAVSTKAVPKKPSRRQTKIKQPIRPHRQRQQLRQIIMEPRGQLVVLGSWPTDEGALAAAASTLVQTRQEGYTVRVVDAAYTRERMPQNTAAYLVHNILDHASDERVEAVRDLMLRWRRPARIIVVGGCRDPYAFCTTRLCLKPDLVGFIQDPV